MTNVRRDLRQAVDEWIRAANERDVEACARLRAPEYVLILPDGTTLGLEEELALVASTPADAIVEYQSIRRHGAHAVAELRHRAATASPFTSDHRLMVEFARREAQWLATRARAERIAPATPRQSVASQLKGMLPMRVRKALGSLTTALPQRAQFQTLAYHPYAPGQDYLLEKPSAAVQSAEELPIPPPELWLGYNYLEHGAEHVAKMLELLESSGFVVPDQGRILDFGCGAGRMIRHLRPLAERCEIWGTDISATHIFWCRQHLSPPFHFATTTKVPHLPFKDESFDLIYCGSVFTHIDDLAEAWLLELRRILKPNGRLYATIHDKNTIELLATARYRKGSELFERHPNFSRFRNADFGMFALARDENSQVFYDGEFFRKMAGSAFEVLSVTEEAYFYQTAYVMKPKMTG